MKCPFDSQKLDMDWHHYRYCSKCHRQFTEIELLGFWLVRRHFKNGKLIHCKELGY